MAKDPAFLFYPKDFLSGTQFFTDEQLGKYLRLLIAQHQTGHLYEKHMLHICKSHDKDIFDKFVKDENGLYYNQRLENEILKRQKYCNSRAENRKKSRTYDLHMVNVNGNIGINKGGTGEILRGIKFSENLDVVIFPDDSSQNLGKDQKALLEMGQLKPKDVCQGLIY